MYLKTITFFLFFIITQFQINSQGFYVNNDMRREQPKLKNYYLVTTVLKDTTSAKNYMSQIQIFDKNGRHEVEYLFNRKGDTINHIKTYYPNKYSEIEVYIENGSKNDTAFYYYNKKNYLTQEIWTKGDDNEIDTTKYYFDKKNRLISSIDVYNFGLFQDIFNYKKNLLINKVSYGDSNRLDSISYIYEKSTLKEVKEFNQFDTLISHGYLKYNEYNEPKLITEFNYGYGFNYLNTKREIHFKYYGIGKIKSTTSFIYSYKKFQYKLDKIIEMHYSILGFLEKYIVKNENGKTISKFKNKLYYKT